MAASSLTEDRLVCLLERPTYDRLVPGASNRFVGLVFDPEGESLEGIEVRLGGERLGCFPCDLPRPDAASYLPHLPTAGRSGFEIDLDVPRGGGVLTFAALGPQGEPLPLFDYDLGIVEAHAERWRRLHRELARLPLPPGELILRTQGGSDRTAYQESVLPAVWNLERYLEAAGADPRALRSILDFGCGSGRVLAGWSLGGEERRLAGCDVDADLIAWAVAHLPGIDFRATALRPPLPYATGELDLCYAISVFTHLPMASQRRWAAELARVLAPGGWLLLTLHGELYHRLFARRQGEDWSGEGGYLELAEGPEGTSGFCSIHGRRTAEELLGELTLAGYFPQGRIGGRRTLFPLATLQDVYVFRAGER